jgi:hypothetical protein
VRYFYYTNENTGLSTVVIVDESSDRVTLYPEEGRTNYSHSKSDWLCHHRNLDANGRKNMYEICENQFKKFKEQKIVPVNWDW